MQNWRQIVERRLMAGSLDVSDADLVILELAAHLEETYEVARSRGLTEKASVELALQEVSDWRVLAAEIRRAKSKEGSVNTRTKKLWLPGMITLLGASLLLAAIQFAGFRPRLVWTGSTAMLLYWPWLAGLPVFGALGAYLSLRAQGSIWARLASAMSPALLMLIVMSVILPFGLATDAVSFFRLVLFGTGLTNWVALPAVALFAGAVPFLRERDSLTRGEA